MTCEATQAVDVNARAPSSVVSSVYGRRAG
jgi:hypothetical protein